MKKSQSYPLFGSCRFHIAIALFFGLTVHYGTRSVLNYGVVCMVVPPKPANITQQTPLLNISTEDSDVTCQEISRNVTHYEGEFDWSREQVGYVLAAFFYGYFPVQVVGGWVSTKFGGKHVMGLGMLIAGIGALLTPMSARLHPNALIALRAVMGVFMGATFPTLNTMIGRWAAPHERSSMLAFSYAGLQIGNILAGIGTGFLCQYSWTITHYTAGVCCLLWLVYWQFIAYSTPEDHPRISKQEKDYILDSLDISEGRNKTVSIPWSSMLRSPAVWAICFSQFSYIWATYTTSMVIPLFMQDVLKFDIKKNGLLSTIPSALSVILLPSVGLLADVLLTKCPCSITIQRKTMQTISFLGASCFLLALGWLDCSSRVLAVPFICCIILFLTFTRGGSGPNSQDIAPRYCGVVYGIANTVSQLTGFLMPLAVGKLTTTGSQSEWQNVFYLCCGIMLVGLLAFVSMASGEVQPWAKDSTNQQQITMEKLITDKTNADDKEFKDKEMKI